MVMPWHDQPRCGRHGVAALYGYNRANELVAISCPSRPLRAGFDDAVRLVIPLIPLRHV
jgi:hypothetical protein